MSRARGWLPTLTCLALAQTAASATAQIATDGTAGPGLKLNGPNYDIGDDLGTRAGRNLFHSFERFSLRSGQHATFRGPDAIRNVISRVTGGERSRINGTIASTMPNADFYFLNPAGVVFGPSAVLDVQGSFHVSTADELRFADGARLSASDPSASYFTVAAPEAFGFLGASPAPITLNQSVLQVPAGEALSIVGGGIDATRAGIGAAGGRITLSAVGGPGEARLRSGEMIADRLADVTLRDGRGLITRGDGSGTIRIRGGAIVVEDATIVNADNSGPNNSQGGIDIDGHSLKVRGGAQLTADVFDADGGAPASGRGGRVSVRADEVEIAADSLLTANTFDQGNAGTVTVMARDLEVRGGARIGSSSSAAGKAGTVTVKVRQLRIFGDGSDRVTGIRSDANAGSTETGDAGVVAVTAREIEIRSGGEIRSSTFGAGDAGTVKVDANRLLISGAGASKDVETGFPALTGISSSVGRGATGVGGTVSVTAEDLELRADGKVRTVTFSAGKAGTVTVAADRVTLRSGGQISSSTLGEGTGESGDVVLTAHETLSVSGRSRFPDEDGGVFPPSGVFASTESERPDARAGGTVTATAPVIRLADRGEIASESFGGGVGGDVRVSTESLEIDNAEITAKAEGSGAGGGVRVRAGALELRNYGLITAQSTGVSPAGAVTVEVGDRLLLFEGSEISTDSAEAGGGRIRLRVGDAIVLRDSGVTTSVRGGTDRTAGNITIDPNVLVIDGGKIQANAPQGFGGRVRIVADNILAPEGDFQALLDREDISASGGDPTRSGTIVVDAPEVDLSGGLVVLEGALLDTASQLRERCGARRDIGASSFTGVGRGGLPPSPDGPLAGAHASGFGAPAVALLPEERGEEVSAQGHSGERAIWPAVAGLAPCRGAL